MSHLSSPRRGALAAIAACSLAAALPVAADAAIPSAGYYSGTTLQPKLTADPAETQYAGAVDFKVFKYGSFNGTVRKIFKVGATTKLLCASGEVKEDRYLAYVILGGQINRRGKFSYAANGFTIKGRFTSRTSAKGTLSRTVGDCKVENVSWTAQRTGGIPLP